MGKFSSQTIKKDPTSAAADLLPEEVGGEASERDVGRDGGSRRNRGGTRVFVNKARGRKDYESRNKLVESTSNKCEGRE